MIKVDNISKKFIRNIKNDSSQKSFGKKTKEEFYAVSGVSFEAKEGEILGILGPNGAGKTTLLRMLASLMTPNDGEVKIFRADGTLIDDQVDSRYEFCCFRRSCTDRIGRRDIHCKDIKGIRVFFLEPLQSF